MTLVDTQYLVEAKRLDQQFEFTSKTPILPTLQRLLTAIEGRLQGIEEQRATLDDLVAGITAVALSRLDDTFTPLVLEAEQRLQQFGAAFNATGITNSLVVGTGAKALVIPAGQREAFIFGDYCVVRHTGGTESMTCRVISYDRSIGQLLLNCVSAIGSGTYTAWDIVFTTAPDLVHAGRTDNPHSVTAAQVGTYSGAELDTILNEVTGDQDIVNTALQRQITELVTLGDVTALQNQITALQTQLNLLIKQTRWIGTGRVKVLTTTSGQGTSVVLGAAASSMFLTPTQAGMINGTEYPYVIEQGSDFEANQGAYTAAGNILARPTPLVSKINNVVSTSKINLNPALVPYIYFP